MLEVKSIKAIVCKDSESHPGRIRSATVMGNWGDGVVRDVGHIWNETGTGTKIAR